MGTKRSFQVRKKVNMRFKVGDKVTCSDVEQLKILKEYYKIPDVCTVKAIGPWKSYSNAVWLKEHNDIIDAPFIGDVNNNNWKLVEDYKLEDFI